MGGAQKDDGSVRPGKNRARGITSSLAHTLYRSLQKEKNEALNRALRRGEVVPTPLKNIEDSNQFQKFERRY